MAVDWLIDWLNFEWSIDWLIDWLSNGDWSIDWLIDLVEAREADSETPEERLVFDSIIDFCDQTYQMPLQQAPSATSFESRQAFPGNLLKFVDLMTKRMTTTTARMVLPASVTGATPMNASTAAGDQDELEQRAVYKLAFEDLERRENEWCNFRFVFASSSKLLFQKHIFLKYSMFS